MTRLHLTSKMSARSGLPASPPRSATNVDRGTSAAPDVLSAVPPLRWTYLPSMAESREHNNNREMAA